MAGKKQTKQASKSARQAKAGARKRIEVVDARDESSGDEASRAQDGERARPSRKSTRAAKKRRQRSAADERPDAREQDPDEGADPGEPVAPAPAAPRRGRSKAPVDLAAAVLLAAATNERMNQFLLDHLDPAAWNAKLPGEGRTIASIVTHVHNVRHMWLAVAAKEFPAPEKLDRRTTSLGQAKTALGASFMALHDLFERSLAGGGKVKDFRPDVVGFLGYLIAHEAHHRGQICLLARQAGFALPKEAGYGLWDWNKRAQECVGSS